MNAGKIPEAVPLETSTHIFLAGTRSHLTSELFTDGKRERNPHYSLNELICTC